MYRKACVDDTSTVAECINSRRCEHKDFEEQLPGGGTHTYTKCVQVGNTNITNRYIKTTITEPKCDPTPPLVK